MADINNKQAIQQLYTLRGIGPRCAEWLYQAGITNTAKLYELGAIEAYLQIIEKTNFRPNICLLYSLVGAIENRDWNEVAQNDKARLKAELEGYAEMGAIAKKPE